MLRLLAPEPPETLPAAAHRSLPGLGIIASDQIDITGKSLPKTSSPFYPDALSKYQGRYNAEVLSQPNGDDMNRRNAEAEGS